MIRQFELVERVQAYDPDADEDVLNRAYVYGLKKHGNQLRASGDPYFSHPVEVAGILAEMANDKSVNEQSKNYIIHNVLNGRWFSDELDAKYGNPSLWPK